MIGTESIKSHKHDNDIIGGDPVLNLIGNTPILSLGRISKNTGGEIFIKLEGCNPSGSLKDRPALYMIHDAIVRGLLQPGMRVLDASSGNMASAIALVAKRLGYRSSFVLGNTLTEGKKAFLKLFGAEIINFDANTWECSFKAAEIAKENPEKYYFTDQFRNKANFMAHYETTGPEIFRDVPDADVYIASLGSGGSVCGAGHFLKKMNPDIKIVAVTAETGTRIPGLRNLKEEGFIPPLADMDLLDDIVLVNENSAIEMVKNILDVESILLSPQGGAVVWAALQTIAKTKCNKVIALMGDASWKNMDILLTKFL